MNHCFTNKYTKYSGVLVVVVVVDMGGSTLGMTRI